MKLFNDNDLGKTSIEELKENFFSKVQGCKLKTNEIINQLPTDWNINNNILETKLIKEIFDNNWIEGSFKLFLEFLQRNNNIKENASTF